MIPNGKIKTNKNKIKIEDNKRKYNNTINGRMSQGSKNDKKLN